MRQRGLGLLWCAVFCVNCAAQSMTSRSVPSTPDQPAPLVLASSKTEHDTFLAAGRKRADLRILLDSVGVVLREGVALERVSRKLAAKELRVVQQYPQGIVILRMPAPLPRPAIMKLARQLVEESDGMLRYVGLVALPGTSVVPFIVPDEIVASVPHGVSEETFAKAGVRIIRSRVSKSRVILKLLAADADPIAVANQLLGKGGVLWAHPNFVRVIDYRQFIPDDPLFPNQWHHRNTGASSGTVDGDVDTPEAWDLTRGVSTTVIAVIDVAFEVSHPDFAGNLWTNAGETAGNGVDDDGDGFTDDVNGWDFLSDDGDPSPTSASQNHGTAVAGVAAARGNNALGVSGSCPECALMFIRQGLTVADDADAFDFASGHGASIITNSWGYAIGTPVTLAVETAINNVASLGRGGNGMVVLFAMNNGDFNDCTGSSPDISSMANVIAVSASSNQEKKVTESAWGDCMDVLAPTHRGYGGSTPFTGTLNIVTTDRSSTSGYNNNSPVSSCPTTEGSSGDARNYTSCFGGTSSAAPLTAGIAGLVLTAAPSLLRIDVQRLLQDTADKMQDSAGAYASTNGFSAPSSGAATHGYGRVNAFEAVRVISPSARNGVDVFLRDNRLDWGNTEQPSNVTFEPTRGFIPHWVSVDIKVDAPPLATTPPATNAAFEAFVDENPISGETNMVYVRVRNRGPQTASSVAVKLHWAFAGAALPSLPSDFWTAFPGDSTDPLTHWTSLGTVTLSSLAYSGASIAGTSTDPAQIATFAFPGPPIDTSATLPHHFCVLAVLDTAGDRPLPLTRPAIAADFIPDILTPNDNNVTHRNLFVEDPLMHDEGMRFYVRNPSRAEAPVRLTVESPREVSAKIDGFPVDQWTTLPPGKEVLVKVRLDGKSNGGSVRITQESMTKEGSFRGGLVVNLAAPKVKPKY